MLLLVLHNLALWREQNASDAVRWHLLADSQLWLNLLQVESEP